MRIFEKDHLVGRGEIGGFEDLDIGAGVYNRLRDPARGAVLEVASDPAGAAAERTAENAHFGFHDATNATTPVAPAELACGQFVAQREAHQGPKLPNRVVIGELAAEVSIEVFG